MGISPPPGPDPTEVEGGTSRRRFLTTVAAGGAALAAGSHLVPVAGLMSPAGAQDGGEDDVDQDTPLTPGQELVTHLVGLTLAAAQGYATAVEAGAEPMSEPVVTIVRQYGAYHSEQAGVLNALLPLPVDTPNTTLQDELESSLGGAADEAAVLEVLRQLEESMAATTYEMLGTLEEQLDARTVASILPVYGQQAVVLGSLAGDPLPELVPAEQGTEGALSVADYPTDAEPDPGGDVEGEGPLGSEGGSGPEPGQGPGEGGTGQPGDGTQGGAGGAEDGGSGVGDEGPPGAGAGGTDG